MDVVGSVAGPSSASSVSFASSASSLPADPNDKYYLTHCYACQASAKPDQEFIRNYGGLVCFSCRAFWRRAHQRCKTPNFYCKRGESCSMSIKARRKCQKCRYQRCKAAGMTREAILTDEQKQIRFRKMLQKKHLSGRAPTSASATCPTEGLDASLVTEDIQFVSDDDNVPLDQLTSTISATVFDFGLLDPHLAAFLNGDSGNAVALRSATFPGDAELGESSRPYLSQIVRQKFRAIDEAYRATLGTTVEELWSRLSKILEKSDVFGRISIEGKIELGWCIQKLTKSFEDFAHYQRHFVNLSPVDRSVLLTRNTPLFVQLNLIMNLVELRQPILENESNEYKKECLRLNYKRFQTLANLFKEDSDVSQYEDLTLQLKSLFYARNLETQAVLAYVILFDFDYSMKLTHLEDLEDLVIMNEILYKKGIEKISYPIVEMKELIAILVKLSVFCSYNLKFDDITSKGLSKSHSPMQLSLVMPYTEEEEIWLGSQLEKLEEAYKSVTLGERIMQEFVLHSLGVSLTQDYYDNYLSVVEERMLQLLKIHPEFHESTIQDQVDVKANNTPLGMAVVMVRGEYCTGIQQIQSGLGVLDEETWNREYLPVFRNTSEIKKASLAYSPKLTPEEAASFRVLAKHAKGVASEKSLFKINLLLVLTSSNNPSSPLGRVHHKYVTLLKRRLEWMYERGLFPEVSSASEIIHKVFSGLHDLGEISKLVQIVTDSFVRKGSSSHVSSSSK